MPCVCHPPPHGLKQGHLVAKAITCMISAGGLQHRTGVTMPDRMDFQRMMAALAMHSITGGGDGSGSSDDDSPSCSTSERRRLLMMALQQLRQSEGNEFHEAHDIDKSQLPKPSSPVQDCGVSIDGLLKTLRPIGVEELMLLSDTTSLHPWETAELQPEDVLLTGRLVRDGVPIDRQGDFATLLFMEDVCGKEVRVAVIDKGLQQLSAAAFAAHVSGRYLRGTTVGVKNFKLFADTGSFRVIAEKPDHGADVFCFGRAALPPISLAQVRWPQPMASEGFAIAIGCFT